MNKIKKGNINNNHRRNKKIYLLILLLLLFNILCVDLRLIKTKPKKKELSLFEKKISNY